ncbi:AT-hook motif nuclear-localized protein 28-like [Juglans microcarpa x Juglans regia]|uniref:AT-hook motif nuclear-localized protein 28-like n=1 Tax=Juglans microcarpa x Juglans regia TaxID=2249226 RepID=UPI001B7DF463|nr:AT-hook motif nuclear-localized protein 28-like [Juglans microcarpa x Juglans regia]
MADYSGGISLPQGRDLFHTSDDESSEHNPRTGPILPATAAGHGSSSSSKPKKTKGTSTAACGTEFGSITEISKKPRGRPPGSKNKPKPPIVITKGCDSAAMKPVILEISAGSDVVKTVMQFANRQHVGISVLCGSGSVSNVTLRHPVSHTPSLTLHGPFNLLSLSGSYLGYPTPTCSTKQLSSSSCLSGAVSFASCSSFGICLAGAQGQVFGGIVGGEVIAASLVVVVVATYTSPAYQRLPGEADESEDDQTKANIDCSGAGTGNGSESCTSSNAMSVSVYSVGSPTPLRQIAPDVML